MNKELKQKWIDALNSGEYNQGYGALCQRDCEGNERYCCLGVLCDLAGLEKKYHGDDALATFTYINYSDMSILPHTFSKEVDLSSECGYFLDSNGYGKSLAQENDDGKSFKEIAAIIEEYF